MEVVDDLLADVHGSPVLLERSLDGVDRALDTGAVATRSCQKDRTHPFIVPSAATWSDGDLVAGPGTEEADPSALGCRMSVGRARVVTVGFGPSGPVLLRTTRASHLPRVCFGVRPCVGEGPSDRGRYRSHRRGRDQEVMRTPAT